jgi:hypothetical protein
MVMRLDGAVKNQLNINKATVITIPFKNIFHSTLIREKLKFLIELFAFKILQIHSPPKNVFYTSLKGVKIKFHLPK